MSFVHPYIALMAVAILIGLCWFMVGNRGRRTARLQNFGDPLLLGRGSALPRPGTATTRQLLEVGAVTLVVLALATAAVRHP